MGGPKAHEDLPSPIAGKSWGATFHQDTEETAMKPCEVKLYALSTCSHCKDTKELLKQCGVDYECVDIDKLDPEQRQPYLETIKKLNPACTFPTLVAGDKVIVGFKKDEIKEALGIS
jgi:glutaredoxin-like protein NrdH